MLVDTETKKPVAFGRLASKDDEFVYVDWYEDYGTRTLWFDDDFPRAHGDPWPLSLYTEVIREHKKR